jgi:peroxiredoxin
MLAGSGVTAAPAPWTTPAEPVPQLDGVVLENSSGEDYHIARALQRRFTVLLFYRGAWCPYSVQMLKELRNLEPVLTGKGFQILAVTPERPFLVREMLDGLELPYVVACDRSNATALAFGLAPVLGEEEARRFAAVAVLPLPREGEPRPRLPAPSLVVLGEDGNIHAKVAGLVEREVFRPAELLRACDEARARSRLAAIP